MRCEAVLFVVSRDWLASGWCLNEFRLAGKLNKRMFGLLIDGLAVADLPPEIARDWQLVDLASGRDHVAFRAVTPDGGKGTARHLFAERACPPQSRAEPGRARSQIFRLAARKRSRPTALSRSQSAGGGRRRHLLRPRGADDRRARSVAWLARGGVAAFSRHPRRLGRRQVVVPAGGDSAAAGARRPAFPDAAGGAAGAIDDRRRVRIVARARFGLRQRPARRHALASPSGDRRRRGGAIAVAGAARARAGARRRSRANRPRSRRPSSSRSIRARNCS